MKIIFLHPNLHEDDPLLKKLSSLQVGVLNISNPADVLPVLQAHAEYLDLIILHRENLEQTQDPGIQCLLQIKSQPDYQKDIPILLSSQQWGEPEFITHQNSPDGVHAYLKFPFSEEQCIETLKAICGPWEETPPVIESGTKLILEDATAILSRPESQQEGTNKTIFLESPDEKLISKTPLERSEAERIQQIGDGLNRTLGLGHFIFDPPSPEGAKPNQIEQFFSAIAIPGGISESPDIQTVKKYLLLREQDITVLSYQLKTSSEHIQALEKNLEEANLKNSELNRTLNDQALQIQILEKQKQFNLDERQFEIEELNFQLHEKQQTIQDLTHQIQSHEEEMENFKERVKIDIRKIRTNEKELNNRLEIMKKDSQILIFSREEHIMELKRRLDLAEFNLEVLQDQYNQQKTLSLTLKDRLTKAAQIVHVAGGFLNSQKKIKNDDVSEAFSEELKSIQKTLYEAAKTS